MCGLVGVLFKDSNGTRSLGKLVLDTLSVLATRGLDGTGVALYGPELAGQMVLRVKLGGTGSAQAIADRVIGRVSKLAGVVASQVQTHYLRIVVDYDQDLRQQ